MAFYRGGNHKGQPSIPFKQVFASLRAGAINHMQALSKWMSHFNSFITFQRLVTSRLPCCHILIYLPCCRCYSSSWDFFLVLHGSLPNSNTRIKHSRISLSPVGYSIADIPCKGKGRVFWFVVFSKVSNIQRTSESSLKIQGFTKDL